MTAARNTLALGLLMMAATAGAAPPPIIDVHLHALGAGDQGPPPVAICAPYDPFPDRDTRQDGMGYTMGLFK